MFQNMNFMCDVICFELSRKFPHLKSLSHFSISNEYAFSILYEYTNKYLFMLNNYMHLKSKTVFSVNAPIMPENNRVGEEFASSSTQLF